MIQINEKYRINVDYRFFRFRLSAEAFSQARGEWDEIGSSNDLGELIGVIIDYEFMQRLKENDYDLPGAIEELWKIKNEFSDLLRREQK